MIPPCEMHQDWFQSSGFVWQVLLRAWAALGVAPAGPCAMAQLPLALPTALALSPGPPPGQGASPVTVSFIGALLLL